MSYFKNKVYILHEIVYNAIMNVHFLFKNPIAPTIRTEGDSAVLKWDKKWFNVHYIKMEWKT